MTELGDTERKFILHWGEMGQRWGINRSVAQIHALLYLEEKPLNAEEISETLSIARSNVSNSIKDLQSWGLVKVAHVLGDRRDHFETPKDIWEIVRIIARERKRRELEPTIHFLQESLKELEKAGSKKAATKKSLRNILECIEDMGELHTHLDALSNSALSKFLKLGKRVGRLLS